MILYQENEKIIRTIELRDKEEILNMFKRENFGFTGLMQNQRPLLTDEIKVIDEVLSKETLAEEYIVLEIEGIIVSYASIYQDLADRIHIGTMVTKQEYRNHGYGTTLIEFVKEYANQNNLTVKTESITCRRLLYKMGFAPGIRYTDFVYKPKQTQNNNKYPIFLDYEGNKKKTEEKEKKELENYVKTLDFLKNIGFY